MGFSRCSCLKQQVFSASPADVMTKSGTGLLHEKEGDRQRTQSPVDPGGWLVCMANLASAA